ncbi:penicillin binding protein PBP4B [Microbulbifer flavimaris]|uniref:Penicillin binding protein PBP4B n=1 Tax=Microbulbifer flavimaris TaxID=1781068 RepID=A0ABX4I162_9GAMM|nr:MULTISPECIES: penicillin binding protein PBP4B [Microbulbifer]KUJ83736.1 esterase [Microbulbifer sp. ZGT114]PCO05908.1 penicillin binding protein PBP4B [Microbulbifer flavimaris]
MKTGIHRTARLLATCLATLILALDVSAAAGERESRCEFPVLRPAERPEAVGFSSAGLARVDQLIEQDIAEGFPGAALLIIKDGRIVKNSQYGFRQKFDGDRLLANPAKVGRNTLFDLASNTKMYATNFALQKLASEGHLDLQAPVQKYLPEFADQKGDPIRGKNKVRVMDLLNHSAGFSPDPQYHNPKVAKALFSQERDKTLRFMPLSPLSYEPGTKTAYSDTDYMLLGLLVERITGQHLDTYVEQQIYAPLGLENTKFNPLKKGYDVSQFAATERMGNTRNGSIDFPNIRRHTLIGEVHDEKAFYSMGGVSGHAGLFSTTSDLAVLLQVMLNGGGYGDVCLFDRPTIQRFTSPSPANATFGLGWRRNANEDMQWMFGTQASAEAYGHTGWTGTLTLIDPTFDLGIVLLTNKKHSPLVEPEKDSNRFAGDLFATGRYGAVATAVYEALLSGIDEPGK